VINSWFPLESSLRIQYEHALMNRLVRRQEEEDWAGIIYGTHTPHAVSVVSTESRADLCPVGVFSARARGEVFLTEHDLVRLDALDAVHQADAVRQADAVHQAETPLAIGLVIAGDKGGFFVREADGSMQTIQSYQEFPVRGPAREKSTDARSWIPLGIAAGVSIVVAMTILAWPASAFTIQPQEGQMRITLHRQHRVASRGARLEIVDGGERRSIAITPELTSVLYAPQTSDVHVRLIR
jgi:hypothetical protein